MLKWPTASPFACASCNTAGHVVMGFHSFRPLATALAAPPPATPTQSPHASILPASSLNEQTVRLPDACTHQKDSVSFRYLPSGESPAKIGSPCRRHRVKTAVPHENNSLPKPRLFSSFSQNLNS